MGTKNKNEMKPISHTGCMTFNGVMRLRLNNGKEYTVRADLGGMALNRADSNHEVVVLLRQHIGYGEVDTGFVVHAKEYDTDRCFGLKPTKKSKMWGIYHLYDVIAWGYADGGCNNPKAFGSCQMRPEDYPQWACKSDGTPLNEDNEVEFEDDFTDRRCVKLRYENGETHVEATLLQDEEAVEPGTNHAKGLLHECAKAFYDFRETHPEVTEMHFYTDDEVEVEN